MSKTAALKTTDTVRAAKRAFFVNLADLTWRMLTAMLLPIFLGAFLDSKFGTGQLFTALGFLGSFAAAALVMKSMYNKMTDHKND